MSETKYGAASPSLRKIFEEALKTIPYPNLQPTGITHGDIAINNDVDVEYGEEYTFTAGTLLDKPLEAAGWIEISRDTGCIIISACFHVAHEGNWNNKNARVLSEHHAILGQYEADSKAWEFSYEAI